MMAPCRVNTRLYCSGAHDGPAGRQMFQTDRMATGRRTIMKNVTDHRYIRPIRLWVTVVSQLLRPGGSSR